MLPVRGLLHLLVSTLAEVHTTSAWSDVKLPCPSPGSFAEAGRAHQCCFSWNMEPVWPHVKIHHPIVRSRVLPGKMGAQSQYKYSLKKKRITFKIAKLPVYFFLLPEELSHLLSSWLFPTYISVFCLLACFWKPAGAGS